MTACCNQLFTNQALDGIRSPFWVPAAVEPGAELIIAVFCRRGRVTATTS